MLIFLILGYSFKLEKIIHKKQKIKDWSTPTPEKKQTKGMDPGAPQG